MESSKRRTAELTRPRASANFGLQKLHAKHAIAARVQRFVVRQLARPCLSIGKRHGRNSQLKLSERSNGSATSRRDDATADKSAPSLIRPERTHFYDTTTLVDKVVVSFDGANLKFADR